MKPPCNGIPPGALEAEAERPGLGDRPVAAQWDPDLAPAMADAGVAVEEETVLEELLDDLGGTGLNAAR